MANEQDPLDELGDLVGNTLKILGNADPYANLEHTKGGDPLSSLLDGPKEAPDTGSGPQDTGIRPEDEEIDLLGGLSSPAPQQSNSHHSNSARSGGGALGLYGIGSTTSFEEQSLVEDDATSQPRPASLTASPPGPVYTSHITDEPLGGGSMSSFPHAVGVASTSMSTEPPSVARSEISTEPSRSQLGGGGSEIGPDASTSQFTGAGIPDEEMAVRVTIKEPEKVETLNSLGIKTHYVQYLVRTDSSLPSLRADGMEVKRRFSDFDALHKLLKQEYRGYFIPPLPEKSYISGKMAHDDFIRLRRADLQAFIKAVVLHPVLREGEPVKCFLLQPGDLTRNPAWTYLVHPPPGTRNHRVGSASSTSGTSLLAGEGGEGGGAAAGIKAGLGSWMSWMKASVAAFVPPKRELSEEEVALRQARELLGDLARLLELAVDAARSLCGHMEGVCGDVRELGRTLAMLSRFEEAVQSKVGQYTEQGASAAARGADLNKVAYGSAKQHAVWKTLSLKTAASLVTLHDYYVLVPEAISALELREGALAALHLLEDDLAAKAHQLELTVAGAAGKSPAAADKKAAGLRADIARLEGAIKDAQAEYATLKERNQSELARLSLQREVDFRRMLALFARTQAGLVQASADQWSTLAKQFD